MSEVVSFLLLSLSSRLALTKSPLNNGHFVIVWTDGIHKQIISYSVSLFSRCSSFIAVVTSCCARACSPLVVESILFNCDRCSFLLYHYIFKLLLKVKRLQQSAEAERKTTHVEFLYKWAKRWVQSGEWRRKTKIKLNFSYFRFYIKFFEFIFFSSFLCLPFYYYFRLMFIVNCMFIFFVKHRATNSFKIYLPVEKYFIILYFMFAFWESTTWEDNHFLKLKTIKEEIRR